MKRTRNCESSVVLLESKGGEAGRGSLDTRKSGIHSFSSPERRAILPLSLHLFWTAIILTLPLNCQSQQFGVEHADDAAATSARTFDRGGTRPRCWMPNVGFDENATISSAILSLKECPLTTQLSVEVIDQHHDQQNDGSGRWSDVQQWTEGGWLIAQNHPIEISVSGTWEADVSGDSSFFSVALVVQLCPVGFTARCTPHIPPPPPLPEMLSSIGEDKDDFLHMAEMIFNSVTAESQVVAYRYLSFSSHEMIFASHLSLSQAAPGTYSLLGSVIVYNESTIEGASIIPFGSTSSSQEQLVTIFEADRAAYRDYQQTPATVNDWAIYVVIALSVVGGCIVLRLLVCSIQLRKTQAYQLAQGNFIIALLCSGLISTCSLVLLEPKNDLYCHLFQPLIVLPIHIMFAILGGRMWRIRAIMSPLLLLTMDKKEHWTTRLVNWVEQISSSQPEEKRIRRTIRDGQLMRVIIVLCLPQIIVQILMLAIRDQEVVVEYSSDELSSGYNSCKYYFVSDTLGILSMIFIFLEFVGLLILAGASKDLPSLFSETQSIWNVALVALGMTFAGALLITGTSTHSSAITAQYLVSAFITGVTTVRTCIRVTWPKIVVARSPVKIMVTKLIADHNRARRSTLTDENRVAPSAPATSSSFDSRNNACGGFALTGFNSPNQTSASNSSPSNAHHKQLNESDMAQDGKPTSKTHSNNLTALQEGEDGDSQSYTSVLAVMPVDSNVQMANEKWKSNNTTNSAVKGNGDDSSTDSSVILMENSLGNESTMLSNQFEYDLPNHSGDSEHHQEASFTPQRDRVLPRPAIFQRQSSMRAGTNRQFESDSRDALICEMGPPALVAHQSDTIVLESHKGPRMPNRQLARPNLLNSLVGSLTGRTTGEVGRPSLEYRHSASSARHPPIPLTIEYNPKSAPGLIRVTADEPPPRRLLIRMIDVQRMLAKVNKAILTGICVGNDDWEDMREACVALGEVFSKEVLFDWEKEPLHAALHSLDEARDGNLPHGSLVKKGSSRFSKQISWQPGLVAAMPSPSTISASILRNRDEPSARNNESDLKVDDTPPPSDQDALEEATAFATRENEVSEYLPSDSNMECHPSPNSADGGKEESCKKDVSETAEENMIEQA